MPTFEQELPEYHGLPRGSIEVADLPPQALAAAGMNDEGVFAAAVELYVNVIDPRTGVPYHDQALPDVAEGATRIAASKCRGLATRFSSGCEERATELEAEAKSHLVEAVDNIESCTRIWDEPITGPDGEITTGRRIKESQQRDELLAKERSAEGDSRHTERLWEGAWRLIAASLLGLLDVLLLWKPLLNLSLDGDSGNVFRWAIGFGLAGLQVLGIELSSRAYVRAERTSADRRGALGDFNRPLRSGFVDVRRQAPELGEIVDADARMSHAYRWLVAVAAFIGVIGGVRVAFLARRAQLESYEAALFGVIIGLILGGLVVQIARLYCRGNLLGDRLQAERDAITELDDRIQEAHGVVTECRENAAAAVDSADACVDRAGKIRRMTVDDYQVAVRLAWTWFGLPQAALDTDEFERLAMPDHVDTSAGRAHVRAMLDQVNRWLAKPPVASAPEPVAVLPAAVQDGDNRTGTELVRNVVPHQPPAEGERHNKWYGTQLIEPPKYPAPPHVWMLLGAVATVAATLVAAFVLPAPETTESMSPSTSPSTSPGHSLVSGQVGGAVPAAPLPW